MPVLETPAVKNFFCRRRERDKRSSRERRTSVDSTKYSLDRRSALTEEKVKIEDNTTTGIVTTVTGILPYDDLR